MKTIGELRKLIREHGGSIEIGKIRLSYEEESDIDLHFDSKIMQWYSSAQPDDASLTDESIVRVHSNFEGMATNLYSARQETQELKEKSE